MKKTITVISVLMMITVMFGAAGLFSFADTEQDLSDADAIELTQESKKDFGYYYDLVSENLAELFDAQNINMLITWGCSVFSVLIVSLLKGSISKLKGKISGSLDSTTMKTNELVEGYNKNSEKLQELTLVTQELKAKLDEKSSIDENINENVRSFAEMLFLVYNGSTTIPEGMKDVLRTKYARLESSLAEKESGEQI